ncbi:MAG: hypothetical protein ACTHZW_07015 [Microbacteriaceae bacterium]|uniref:hypothetical protein n=1 Tax=Microbacterium sp. TaxID=51671 RepID=UPI003F9601D9
MSYEDYEAALEDLRKDSAAWGDISETFSSVVTMVEGCALPRFSMDGMGHMVGAEENYSSAHSTIYDLLSAAPGVFEQISTNLSDTKARYEEADGYAQWQLDQD